MSPVAGKFRIIVVEDQLIFRELLAEVLTNALGCEVVAQMSEGADVLTRCRALRPDLLILDVILPDMSGVDVLAQVRAADLRLPVIMVTGHARPEIVKRAVALGAEGFVTKSTPLSELRMAVDRVLHGIRYYCSEANVLLTDALRQKDDGVVLSSRQKQIVQLVAQGLTSKEIAKKLNLSAKTVSNHRLQIRAKLGVNEVAGLTRYAIEHGLVEAKV